MDSRQLNYWEEGSWKPLPEWASFYLELGALFGRQTHGGRLVAGVAAPINAYAASLLATGIVATRMRVGASQTEIKRHFEMLCRLPEGTPISYRDGARQLRGFFEGIISYEGQKRIKVRVESTRGTQARSRTVLLLPDQALQAAVSNSDYDHLPLIQRGRVVIDRPEFIEAFLGLNSGALINGRCNCEVLVVGEVNRLHQEICETRLAIQSKDNKGFIEGHLQDILCVRRFAGSGPYKSDIHAARTAVGDTEEPPFVVFAGAKGYLEWRNHWQAANWILVLDKTSSQFEDATSLFNEDVYKYGLVDAKPDQLPAIPPGVEASILCQE